MEALAKHRSNNDERQRRRVAECHADLKRKRRDLLHKLSAYYAREYDLIVVEDLDVKGRLGFPSNSCDTASARGECSSYCSSTSGNRAGTHFVAVEPAGTTKECAACGVSTDKPLWVCEHSCPAYDFTADRNTNAAWNILSRDIRSGTLRINACGDCAPCRYVSICKARR